MVLEKRREVVGRDSSLTNQSTKRPFGKFLVVRHGQATMWFGRMSHYDVTAGLMVYFIAEFAQSLGHVAAGNYRQSAQTATSTTSSVMAGGTGSPCLARLSR
jgi:hypothetical protein